MSEQEESVKKVVHRIEPKQQPIVLPNTSGSKRLEDLSHLPKTVNAQFFQQQLTNEDQVENGWGPEVAEVETSGRRRLLAAVLVLAAFFLGCAIWALVLISGGEKQQTSQLIPAVTGVSFDEKSERRNKTIVAYLAASTVAEKALHVRDPERVRPLMEKYYQKFPLVPEQLSGRVVESSVLGKQGVLWRVKARDNDTYGSIHLLVETNDDGRSLVDWETDVVYQPSSWSSFRSTKSTELHTFRAMVEIAQLDGFHGFEFSEYNKFRCFKVTLPGSDDYLWAYTEIGSSEDKKMVNLITSGGRRNIKNKRAIPVVLELRYPENAQSARCVHLGHLVQAGWLH